MKKRITALLAALLLFSLAACSPAGLSRVEGISVPPAPSFAELEPVSTPTGPAYYPAMPSIEGELLDESYWRTRELPLTIHGMQPNFKRGEIAFTHNGPYLYIPSRLAQDGVLKRYIVGKSVVMPLEDYTYYVEKFFGPENASLLTEKTFDERDVYNEAVDWENGTITLELPYAYDIESNTLNIAELGFFVDDWKFTEIAQYTQDERITFRIEVERYEDATLQELFRIETFVLYWDDEVGFIVESSSWRWNETNQVRVAGEVTRFDTLWGATAEGISPTNFTMPFGGGLYARNHQVYRFHATKTVLTTDIYNFETAAQALGKVVWDFKEPITGVREAVNGLIVRTNAAVYRLDGAFQVVERKPWPAKLLTDLTEYSSIVLNGDLTYAAYDNKTGIYLCPMTEDATPTLLQAHPTLATDSPLDSYSLYPIRFIGQEELLCGAQGYETISSFYRILDAAGNTLKELRMVTTGIFAGGYLEHNNKIAVFFGQRSDLGEERDSNYYYRYDTGTLYRADWLTLRYNDYEGQCIPDPNNPYVWYFGPQLLRVDFENKTVTQLPVSVEGAPARLLAVCDTGELLFSYNYKNEQGFCVYRLQ